MLPRLMSLCASLFGRFSTICVELHSAGKFTGRMALALLLVPFFVVPSFAVETDVMLSPVTGYGYVSNTSGGDPVYEPFIEDWVVSHNIDLEAGQTFNFYNENIYERTTDVFCNYSTGNRMDVLFYLTGNDVQFVNAELMTPVIIFFANANDFLGDLAAGDTYPRSPSVQFEFWVDGVFIDSYTADGSAYLPAGTFSYDGAVEEYVEIRATCLGDNLRARLASAYPACTGLVQIGLLEYYVGNKSEYSDQFKVVFTKLDDINENIQISNSYLIKIDDNVATLQQDVSDTKQQLETPGSTIWQAAGETIKDAVTNLFVPSQEQITDVKQQFDELAQDKLGGAYTAMDTVDQTINDLNDKLNSPSAQQGIEFPGISVPLGGDVGTVDIVPAQTVTLPTQLMSVFHPIAGVIIPIIVGLGTFNTLKDLVACFLSGYSYSEYLHRNKGGGDE